MRVVVFNAEDRRERRERRRAGGRRVWSGGGGLAWADGVAACGEHRAARKRKREQRRER